MNLEMMLMSAALLAYTVGVWSERLQGRLKAWHLVFFWLGLAFDTAGTEMMRRLAGGFTLDFHGITGGLALSLMLVHAIWASIVLWRRNERAILSFHRFSVVVWAIWLIPMFSPMVFHLAQPARPS